MDMSSIINTDSGLWEMVANAGPVVKLVLLVLLAFSVISWAIIIYKTLLLRKAEKETAAFYDLFWEKRKFPDINAAAALFRHTPLSRIFSSIYSELTSAARAESQRGDIARIKREDIVRLQRLLKKVTAEEAARLEYAIPFLATAGNTAPFIGLFGTVWGIMNSFRSIGAKGAANLAVVAPGISEALVATAMGLLVAIPAVVAYNHLLSKISRITAQMESFSSDLINIIEKEVSRKAEKETAE